MRGLDEQRVAALALSAGLGDVQCITPMTGGANNRVFRVETTSRTALLKSYFRHPDDPRDRLGAEFAFSRFAWEQGVRALPQPLACDASEGLALFVYVHGRLLRPEEVDDTAVDQAIDFFLKLNRNRHCPAGPSLPRTSESCLSLDDHLTLVERRVDRLQTMAVASDADTAAEAFVRLELAPACSAVLDRARKQAADWGLSCDAPLPPGERCLSPSDFGYHNALLADDGQIRFIDFEYAGWDDPSKLVCDFFCQPALPAPSHAYERFALRIAAEMPLPELHVARSNLLLPVYRVKWCCIMLNEFLAVGSRRRTFSSSEAEGEERKIRQLQKARIALEILGQSLPPTRIAA